MRASAEKIQPIIALTVTCVSSLYEAPEAEPIRRHAPFNATEASAAQLSDTAFASTDEITAINLLYPRLQECQKNTLLQMSTSMLVLVPILAQAYANTADRVTLLTEQKIDWGEYNKKGRDAALKFQNQALTALQNRS